MGTQSTPQFLQKHINPPSAVVLFLSAALVVLSISACSGKKNGNAPSIGETEPASAQSENNSYKWYCWDTAGLVGTGGVSDNSRPGELKEKEWKLWTDQVRGIRFLYKNGNAYCAVNTLGVVVFRDIFNAGTPLRMSEIYKKRVFTGRTVGRFFAYGPKLYTQLYYNTVLHSGQPPAPGVALASFHPESGEIRILPFTFQDENAGWELAALHPYSLEDGVWLMVWKHAGDEKTEFRYTELDVHSWEEREINEQQFLAAITPAYGINAPVEVQRLLRMADGNRGGTVFDITVSYAGNDAQDIFRFGDIARIEREKTDFVRLRCFSIDDSYYLLLPEGRVLWLNGKGEKGEFRLPELPEKYVYTDLITDGSTVLALWEEQDFTSVRRAGFVYKSGT